MHSVYDIVGQSSQIDRLARLCGILISGLNFAGAGSFFHECTRRLDTVRSCLWKEVKARSRYYGALATGPGRLGTYGMCRTSACANLLCHTWHIAARTCEMTISPKIYGHWSPSLGNWKNSTSWRWLPHEQREFLHNYVRSSVVS